jgi:hypothetical protein
VLFKCQVCDRLERQLLAERVRVNDLADKLLALEVQFGAERAQLVERIMSLARPEALREYRRALFAPGGLPEPKRPEGAGAGEAPPNGSRRLHFPGYQANLRPPSPLHPPSSEPEQ